MIFPMETRELRLDDRRMVRVRPLRPADRATYERAVVDLSPRSRYLRFFAPIARLIAWVQWRSRGTLRMTPLSVVASGEREVVARTRNTAKRGKATLDLEMTLVFSLNDGRVSSINESVQDLSAWKKFWR